MKTVKIGPLKIPHCKLLLCVLYIFAVCFVTSIDNPLCVFFFHRSSLLTLVWEAVIPLVCPPLLMPAWLKLPQDYNRCALCVRCVCVCVYCMCNETPAH